MKVIANNIGLQYNEFNQSQIILTIKGNILPEFEKLKAVVSKDKELSCEIKQYRVKRSLDSNAYMWLLLGEMAGILNTTKDELYLIMLGRYGVYTHIVVKPSVVEKVKLEWKTVKELGVVMVNGSIGMQLQCYFGSSTYDTKEMSKLVDGVVIEAKEMGIDTMTNKEISLLNSKWGI